MIPRYTAVRLNLAYKDTDSLLYCIETSDLYQDMACFKHLLDLYYPREHFLYDPTNKKVSLTMTDEMQNAKGVSKTVEKTLHHDLFKQCLLSKKNFTKRMSQLRSFNHQIVVNSVDKIALSSFDDKRYILDDGIISLACGHYKIPSSLGG